MMPFEMSGLWWLPGTPESKVGGTLRGNEEGEIRLELIGGFGEPWMVSPREERLLVHGIAQDQSGATLVTLANSFVTRDSVGSADIRHQTLFVPRAYLGGHLSSPNTTLFTTATLQFSGLSSWAVGLTGFAAQQPSQGPHVSWSHPSEAVKDVAGAQLLLGLGCTASARMGRERIIREYVTIRLTFDNPIYQAELDNLYFYPLHNFLTFATDRPNALTNLSLGYGPNRDKVTVRGPVTFTDEKSGSDLMFPDMLFTLKDIRDRFDDVLTKWIHLHRQHRGAFAVYFGNLYDASGFVDARFQLLLQAVSIYFAGESTPHPLSVDAYMTATQTDELNINLLKEFLYEPPVWMAQHAISSLAEKHSHIFAAFIGGDSPARQSAFTKRVVGFLRNILLRPQGRDSDDTFGSHVYILGEQVAALFKIELMSELGFSTDEITNLLGRNRRLNHLRAQVAATPF